MPFDNDDWLKTQQSVGLKSKALEELLIARTAEELASDMTASVDTWVARREAALTRMSRVYQAEIKRAAPGIHADIMAGLQETMKVSARDIINLVPDKADAVNESTTMVLEVGKANAARTLTRDMQLLYSRAINEYRAAIPRVKLDSRGLFDAITDTLRRQSDGGYVVYQGGRKMSYKSYMEMSVRTEMQNNALYNLERSASAAGVKIYKASAHGDCADDHEEYQGLYYLADGAEWLPAYENYAFHPTARYLSDAKAAGFLTRPNCRHYVMPISPEQLGDDIPGLLDERVRPGKYEALQEQRKNERMIRQYKNRMSTDEIMLAKATDPVQQDILRGKLQRDRTLVRDWQRRQRETVAGSGLKRQYIRERPGVIVEDLGARRKLKITPQI